MVIEQKKKKKKQLLSDRILSIVCYAFMIIAVLITLIPFLNVVAKAFSAEWAVMSGEVGIWPVGFQLDTMKSVITSDMFVSSFLVSIFVTVVGTIMSLLLTAVTAYPLSKRHLPFMKPILILFVFTMLFSGGMVPSYMLVKNIGLMNNVFSLILPVLISVYNMLIIKSYYEGLPEALEEAAKLDGATNVQILFRIILPMSTPVLATIGLFYAVAFWNDYFNAMLYISDPDLKPLQLYLREIILQATQSADTLQQSSDDLMNISPEGVRSATIVASTIPILITYPFAQKYFVKGVTLGSVKG